MRSGVPRLQVVEDNSFFCRESRSLCVNVQAEQTSEWTDYRRSVRNQHSAGQWASCLIKFWTVNSVTIHNCTFPQWDQLSLGPCRFFASEDIAGVIFKGSINSLKWMRAQDIFSFFIVKVSACICFKIPVYSFFTCFYVCRPLLSSISDPEAYLPLF